MKIEEIKDEILKHTHMLQDYVVNNNSGRFLVFRIADLASKLPGDSKYHVSFNLDEYSHKVTKRSKAVKSI